MQNWKLGYDADPLKCAAQLKVLIFNCVSSERLID